MTYVLDLFGTPCRLPNGKRGRPAHAVSDESCNKVKLLIALGWTKSRIANALQISEPTFNKYYFSFWKEREQQRDRLDAQRLMRANEQAETGNVGAMRLFEQMVQRSDAMIASQKIDGSQVADRNAAKPKPLGKKEAAREAAERARSGESSFWGDDLNPGYENPGYEN